MMTKDSALTQDNQFPLRELFREQRVMLIFSVGHLAGLTLDKNKDKRPSVA